jgi:hypothetical protein
LSIPHFKNPAEFKDKDAGILKLGGLSAMSDKQVSVATVLEQDTVKNRYSEFIEELSGGMTPLQYGLGSWLERMSGKEIFRVLANQCFEVKDLEGNLVKGKEQNKIIAKGLVKLPIQEQPQDFQNLVKLLQNKVGGF